MKIANIKARESKREEIRNFFGLNRRPLREVGESADEGNIGFDMYPFLSPKSENVRLTDSFGTCRALSVKDQAAWITDVGNSGLCKLFYAGGDTGLTMPSGKKQTVSMGTKIIIFPDKLYYDTVSGEHGSLDAFFESAQGVSTVYTLCRIDGGEYDYDSSSSAPVSPGDGALWCDTSTTPATLKKYSASSDTWVPVDSTFVKISSPLVGQKFNVGDGVTISQSAVQSLNGAAIIEEKGEDFIVVTGIIPTAVTQTTQIKVERVSPEVDLALEYSNRLWACRSGLDRNGNLVNEIYASKLGDPFNWNCFSGLVSDSYAASVGSDGPFTGAAVFLGYVMFFKERCVHKVFGNRPANFQIITNNIRGVAAGAESSLAIIDDVLYYGGADGVTAYDGAAPETVSEALGDIDPDGMITAVKGKRLYVSAKYEGVRELYVFDTKLSVWHRYAPMNAEAMAGAACGVLAAAGGALWVIDSKDLGIGASALTGFNGRVASSENWYFETGELTSERDDLFVEKIELTAAVPSGGRLSVSLIGDDGENYPVVTVQPALRRTYTIPIVTDRHRRYRLYISGRGKVTLYSISKFVEKGKKWN